MNRTCGGCTACCKTHYVREIEKLAGTWCEKCQIGKGCKIYKKRPKSCRNFECAWLSGMGDERSRPDIIGVVSEYREFKTMRIILVLWEVRENAFRSQFVRSWTFRHINDRYPVMHIPISGECKLFLNNGRKYPKTKYLVGDIPSDIKDIRVVTYELATFELTY